MPGRQGFEPGPRAQSRHPLERNADNWQKGQMGCQPCSQQEYVTAAAAALRNVLTVSVIHHEPLLLTMYFLSWVHYGAYDRLRTLGLKLMHTSFWGKSPLSTNVSAKYQQKQGY